MIPQRKLITEVMSTVWLCYSLYKYFIDYHFSFQEERRRKKTEEEQRKKEEREHKKREAEELLSKKGPNFVIAKKSDAEKAGVSN